MNIIKKIIRNTTGYWLHKLDTLPVGTDLFVDLQKKLHHHHLNTLFDVGANVGQTRAWFRSNLPSAKIYSFEPVKQTFEQLKEAAANDSNCVLENLALGDEKGEKRILLHEANMSALNSLHEISMNNTPGAVAETVTIDTLDNYCEITNIRKIDLLKIDTEGYELNVLKGSEEMMANGKIPAIFCEVGFQKRNVCNTSFAQLTEYLDACDYFFFGLYQISSHDWRRGNHIGNALFIHKAAYPA